MRWGLLLFFVTSFLYSQDRVDKLVLNSGDTLLVKVLEVGVKDIKFQYPDSSIDYHIKRKKISKIIEESGREVVFKKPPKNKPSYKKSFEVGFTGGSSSSLIRDLSNRLDVLGNMVTLSPLDSYVYGLMFRYNFTNKLSIRSKLLSHNKGEVYNFSYGGVQQIDPNYGFPVEVEYDDVSERWNYNYITCPILLEYNIKKERLSFFISSGIYVGYLYKLHLTYNPKDHPLLNDSRTLSTSNKNSFDFGGVLGVGLSRDLGKNIILSCNTSLDYGLQKLNPNGYETYNLSSSLSIGLSYLINK